MDYSLNLMINFNYTLYGAKYYENGMALTARYNL